MEKPVRALRYPGAIDADGHILEPPDLWERYIDPSCRNLALRIRRDADGLEYLEIGGKPSERSRRGFPGTLGGMGKGRQDIKPSPERTYVAGAPFGSMDADERLELLDRENLEAAVLYPTLGDPLGGRAARRRALASLHARLQPLDRRLLRAIPADGSCRSRTSRSAIRRRPRASSSERCGDGVPRRASCAPFTLTRKPHGHPDHDRVFAAAQDLDVAIAIHPTFEPSWALRGASPTRGARASS